MRRMITPFGTASVGSWEADGEVNRHPGAVPHLSPLQHLNAYSRLVADALLAAFPCFIEFIQVASGPGTPQGSLVIRMTQPSANQEPGLYIATHIHEITVGFRACYVHFADSEGPGPDEHLERAVTYIRDLLEDRIVMKKWYRNGMLCGSAVDTPSVLPSPSRNGITTVEMISWTGANDKIIIVPAAS